MKIFNSMFTAFAMYSRLPARAVEWNEENMRYTMCFVPLIGVVCGVVNVILWMALSALHAGNLMYAGLSACIPLLISGGIHMDGYLDTVDAVASYRTKEKRLEILKDPHVGSFAVINTGIYFTLMVCAYASFSDIQTVTAAAFVPVISRCMGCFMAISVKNAKKEGTLFTFTNAADRMKTGVVLVTEWIIAMALSIFAQPFSGLVLIPAVTITAYWCYKMADRRFGGVTGDIIGYTITLLELTGIIAVMAGDILWNLL